MPISLEQLARLVGLRLEPFQRQILRAIDGPQREALVLLPRGSGKTSLLAVLTLHHLLTVDRAEIYCAAASREQARVLFEMASRYARILGEPRIIDRHLELRWCEDPAKPRVFDRHLRVLAADAPRLHGLTPSLAIVDELHAHADDQVYLALLTSLAKRPGSKLITISSAGQGHDTPLGRLRARALGQPSVKRTGALTTARGRDLVMLEWAVPEGKSLTPKAVKAANPASWVTTDGLRAQMAAVPDAPFRQYHCGQWVEREKHWLGLGVWQRAVGQPNFEAGQPVTLAVLIGGQGQRSAVMWVAGSNVGCWLGDEQDVEATIGDLAENYKIGSAVIDPWQGRLLAADLEARGLRVISFPRTSARMVPASAKLHEAIAGGSLVLPDDPELGEMSSRTIARQSARGWQISGDDAAGIVALAMAHDEATAEQPAECKLLGWL